MRTLSPRMLAAPTSLSRRMWLKGAGALGCTGVFPSFACAAETEIFSEGLKDHAARKGLIYGAAVEGPHLRNNLAYQETVLRECDWIVPTYEMKWGVTGQIRGNSNYARPDFIVDFALRHGLKVRGHTAIWYLNIPKWLGEALHEPEKPDVFDTHIQELVTHYHNRIREWDVVNEAIDFKDGQPHGLRNSIFLQALGPDYIARAYRVAREADPTAVLVYNDFGVEYPGAKQEARRRAMLEIVQNLRRENLIDGVGLQCHVNAGQRFDAAVFRKFLKELADLGVSILISEFDVNDTPLGPDIETRDQAVAAYAKDFLDVALDEQAVRGVISWGISDKYTWLNEQPFARKDGAPSRALPFDGAMRRKPLWNALASAFDHAPQRAHSNPIARTVK